MKSRRLDPELLDDFDQDPDELAESLVMVGQVNRWLGGLGGVRRALDPFRGRPCRILDVGCGNGDTSQQLLGGSGAERWSITPVDLNPLTARIAIDRHAELRCVVADALVLPFPTDTFDVAVSFLTLHHFDDEGAAAVLREMRRVTRGLVLVSDLERHSLNYWGARLMASTLWRGNRLTRTDGPHSVLKSFRTSELLGIAARAGLERVTVRRHPFFRLLLQDGEPT